ncbi:MAG TPA: hypothetical protein DCM64_02935 [Gammaproteobacteria bacterium]|nr:hypothetical protein [Gammaproteobacteria bacterium]
MPNIGHFLIKYSQEPTITNGIPIQLTEIFGSVGVNPKGLYYNSARSKMGGQKFTAWQCFFWIF